MKTRVFLAAVLITLVVTWTTPNADGRAEESAQTSLGARQAQALLENLDLRFVPSLTFHIDDANERGRRIDALLALIVDQLRLGEAVQDQPRYTDQGPTHNGA